MPTGKRPVTFSHNLTTQTMSTKSKSYRYKHNELGVKKKSSLFSFSITSKTMLLNLNQVAVTKPKLRRKFSLAPFQLMRINLHICFSVQGIWHLQNTKAIPNNTKNRWSLIVTTKKIWHICHLGFQLVHKINLFWTKILLTVTCSLYVDFITVFLSPDPQTNKAASAYGFTVVMTHTKRM